MNSSAVSVITFDAWLPRFVVLRGNELGAEFVQLAVRGFELLINQSNAGARRLDHPGCNLLFEDA